MCTIYLNSHVSDLDLAAVVSQLSPQRRDYLLRFRKDDDRRAVAAAWFLLCRALREQYGICESPRLAFGCHGKPFLADHPQIHFNLSHCSEVAVCAIDTKPVGVDVETVAAYDPTLLTATMNGDEIKSVLSDAQPDRAFMRLWTRKEAVFKNLGTGITDHIRDILSHPLPAGLRLHTFDSEHYVCSLCGEGESIEIRTG